MIMFVRASFWWSFIVKNNLQGLRSNARAKVGHLHGKLCKWWWLLPLLLLCRPWLRQDCPSWYICSRLPTYSWGPALWNPPAAEEDQQAQGFPDLVDQIRVYYVYPPVIFYFFLYLWKNKTKLCCLTLCKLSLLSVTRLFSRDCCSRQAISGDFISVCETNEP